MQPSNETPLKLCTSLRLAASKSAKAKVGHALTRVVYPVNVKVICSEAVRLAEARRLTQMHRVVALSCVLLLLGACGTNGTSNGACGACPTGYTCGSANGLPVCRSKTSNIPLFSNVYVVMMENTSLATLQAGITSGKAPNLKAWAAAYATASDYHGVAHPSLPNYIGLTSGDTQGIGCDCGAQPGQGTCTALLNLCLTCSCDNTAKHIGDQLEAVSKTWMDFGEDMGAPCNLTDSGNYVTRHNPFLYYDDVQTPSSRCTAHVVDFKSFDPNAPAAFNFIAPNLVDDMHNPDPPDATNIPSGDTWLGAHVSSILQSAAYKKGGLLVIVWDEDDGSGGLLPPYTDDPVGLWVMSPYAKRNGYVSHVHANHYALLATFEDGLGVSRLANAAAATPLGDFFPAN
jgi:hypothetical protein